MASTNLWLCCCFVETPVKFTFRDVPLTFQRKTGGDIFWFRRTATGPLEVAVVLGVGVTKHEAKVKANNYFRRIGRIHGFEDSLPVLEFECTQETQFSEDL
ncbi:uncharacterized protein LOC127748761 [Frankliniella occidentalis]|uniref:Uncharacterized protein LOC127748761 n=1 Tax=Frankliniella occidentalis TaxID=133901 RepID=A0A9C6U1A9_FRAOC|nr:uncharacterized protein LOC127748761 [Frankliniella occidentalis]